MIKIRLSNFRPSSKKSHQTNPFRDKIDFDELFKVFVENHGDLLLEGLEDRVKSLTLSKTHVLDIDPFQAQKKLQTQERK